MQITLTQAEHDAAYAVGVKRNALRRSRGKAQEYNDGGGTTDHRNGIGAVAEYALAKLLGSETLKDWAETKSFSTDHHKITCDVGKNLHVRATENPKARLLIIHPYDPGDGVFVMAHVRGLSVTFDGWEYASNVQQPENWRDSGPGFFYRPAYTLDNAFLRPMDTIPEEAK